MKRRVITTTLVLALAASAACAGGRSAAGQRELIRMQFQRKIDGFLTLSRRLYFAAACRVIPRMYASLTQTDTFISLDRAWSIRLRQNGLDSMMEELADIERRRGEQAGLEEAAQKGCGYWHDHPVEVYEFRRQVGYEIAPAGPANF